MDDDGQVLLSIYVFNKIKDISFDKVNIDREIARAVGVAGQHQGKLIMAHNMSSMFLLPETNALTGIDKPEQHCLICRARYKLEKSCPGYRPS